MSKLTWAERAESFERIRAHLRQIFHSALKPLDVAEIATKFKDHYRYLPSIERRLRELVDAGEIKRNPGRVPTYEKV